MNQITPAEVTARAEPTANQMSGEFGEVCQTCTAPRRVQFFYDDPLKTPVTDLTTRFLRTDNTVLAETRTYHSLNFGAQDATAAIPGIRDETGVAEQQDLPHGPLNIDTGDPEDIESAADEAWELEKSLVGDLWTFEQAMTRTFRPYVEEWNNDGWLGAGGDFVNGVGKGLSIWWNGEKDFWGSAWGWLKSTSASVGSAVWTGVTNPIDTAQGLGRAAWDGAQAAYGQLENLVEVLKALLTGDIDGFFQKIQLLEALKTAGGAIGEFGQLIYDAFQNGVEWLNALIEMIRRTPVLGLIANTAMRVITMMTPNFWAEMVGTGGGFVIPEVIIWLICLLIGALAASTGAGAAPAIAALAARAAATAAKIRNLIKGSGRTFAAISQFLGLLEPIVSKIGPLGRKLRESIQEGASGVVDKTQKLFRRTRYYREKLADLARQGHGPQRHEGDVTDSQLRARIALGVDPMNASQRNIHLPGARVDSVTGKTHRTGRHATKFNTPADYVRAYEKALENTNYKAFLNSSEPSKKITLNASDVFGPNFQARMKGYSTRSGTPGPSTDYVPTVFGPDTKIYAIFVKDSNGIPKLLTMYPDP